MALPRCDTWPHAVKTPIRFMVVGIGCGVLLMFKIGRSRNFLDRCNDLFSRHNERVYFFFRLISIIGLMYISHRLTAAMC